jgi:M6 family metalloprotease-like protein
MLPVHLAEPSPWSNKPKGDDVNTTPSKIFIIFVLLALAWVTGGTACIGADGTLPPVRSIPTLRVKPDLIPEGLPGAGRAQPSNEYVLILLVEFKDQKGATTQEAWRSEMFGGTYSMSDYFRVASYYYTGLTGLNLIGATESSGSNNGVAGWYQVAYDKVDTPGKHYDHPWNAIGPIWRSDTRNAWSIVEAAVCSADVHVNFAQLDLDDNGYISSEELHIIVVLAGYEESYGKDKQPATWRHHSSLVEGVMVDSVVVLERGQGGGYSMVGELAPSGAMIEYGLVCHEMGHDLGLPDLYDTDKQNEASNGIGEWGLMSSGDWCNLGTLGDCPVLPCAWSKIRLGWISPTTVGLTLGDIKIPQVATSPVAYKLLSGEDQYYLVTNRQRVGYDRSLVRSGPADGLLIWHIDEGVIDSLLIVNKVNAYETHKGVDLECADAYVADHIKDADHLDAGENRGDATDPWYSGNDSDFDAASVPDTRSYENHSTIAYVRNVSLSSDTMTANMWGAFQAVPIISFQLNQNGGTWAISGPGSGDTVQFHFTGWDCSGTTDLYEWDGSTVSWMKVNTWGWNVAGHPNFRAGRDVRRQEAMYSGDFKMVCWGLCGLGCDEPADSGFHVDVHLVGDIEGTSDSNMEELAGWNIGFRDTSWGEFAEITEPVHYYNPTVIGDPLIFFPAWMGSGWVEELNLDFDVPPNMYWEDMSLGFTVAEVDSPGMVQIFCGDAEFPETMVLITTPGYYEAELGWMHVEGPTTITVSSGDASFAWDWMSLMAVAPSLYLTEPPNMTITNDSLPGVSWSAVTNALKYHVEWARDADFSVRVVDDSTLTEPEYVPSASLPPDSLGDGFYWWRVAAQTYLGVWSEPTVPRIFIYDSGPPIIMPLKIWADTVYAGPYHIEVAVEDSVSWVGSVTLYYRYNEAPWDSTSMTLADTTYSAWIEGVTDSTLIDYYVKAMDAAGNAATDPDGAPSAFHRFSTPTAGTGQQPYGQAPVVFALSRNHPNPFRWATLIRYSLPRACYARLEIFNTRGKKVETLVDGYQPAGHKTVNWDASSLASGVYFYRLTAGDFVKTRKMVLLK